MKSVIVAGALVLALIGGTASAFTYDGHSSFNSDGSQRLTDPDDQLTNGSKSSKSKSGFSMQFGGGPTASNGAGAQSRFLPSGNRAFNSPFQQNNLGSPYNQN